MFAMQRMFAEPRLIRHTSTRLPDMTHFILIGFTSVLAHTALDWQLPRVRFTRNGGLRFFRVGRLQLSWGVCRASI